MADSAGDEVGYAQLDAMGGFETETLGNLKTKLFTQIDPVTGLYYDGNTFYDPALGLYLQPHPNNGPEPTGGFSPLSGGVPRLVDGSPGNPSLGFVSSAIGFGKSALHDYGSANNLWFYGRVTQRAYLTAVSYRAQVSVNASKTAIMRLKRHLRDEDIISGLTSTIVKTSKTVGTSSNIAWRLSVTTDFLDAPLLKEYFEALQGDILPASSNRRWRAEFELRDISSKQFPDIREARFTVNELLLGAVATDFILEAGFQFYDDLSDPYWSLWERGARAGVNGLGGAGFGTVVGYAARVACLAAGFPGIGQTACAGAGALTGSALIWGKWIKPLVFDPYLRNNRLKLSPL